MLLSFWDFAMLTIQSLGVLFSITVYIFLAVTVFPSVFLKPRYRYSAEGDRGIRRYIFEGGRAIVYEPCAAYRKYLKSYILSANGREKYIKCKFSESVRYVIYDVIAFDSADRVLDTVRVKEDVAPNGRGISKASLLHPQTAYAKVAVRAVNQTPVAGKKLFFVSVSSMIGFVFCVTVALIAEAVFLRSVIESFTQVLWEFTPQMQASGRLFTVVSALILGLVLSGVLLYLYRTDETVKKIKRKGKTAHSVRKRSLPWLRKSSTSPKEITDGHRSVIS